MMRILLLAALSWLLLAPGVAIADDASPGEVLTAMFEWWNEAIHETDGFTAEAFSQYWTDDAVMIINGNRRGPGPAELARHFRAIRDSTDDVEIMLPFREGFDAGDRTFTYHYVRGVRGGETSYSRVMGFAEIRDGRIALIDFLSAPIEGDPPPADRAPADY